MRKYPKINIITSAPREPESSILIIYTGGTLGMVHDEAGALVPFDFSAILDHVPSLRKLELKLTVVSFEDPIDSSNINISDWKEITHIIYDNYHDFDGFVVLHGTDTMAFTASAVSFMLENLNKPVIFTGAQLPISSVRSDARENLITALEIASAKNEGRPQVPEVCIYFDYVLLRGNRSKKVESLHFDAFESENYPELAKSGVIINYNQAVIMKPKAKDLVIHDRFETKVVILKLFPGIAEDIISSILHTPGLKGVIIETYGSGNAPTDAWFINVLKEAVENGVVILNISQCPGGRVIQGRYNTSREMQEIGVIGGADMTVEAAVSKLMLALGESGDKEEIIQKLTMPMCGEMTATD